MKPLIFIPIEKEKGMIPYYLRLCNQLDDVLKPQYKIALEYLPIEEPVPTSIIVMLREEGDAEHGTLINKTPYNDAGGNI